MGELFHVYSDESRQTQDRFMVFGGILVRGAAIPTIHATITQWRTEERMVRELKWTKVSQRKLPEYESLVDLFFTLAEANRIRFRSVVFDTSQIDYRKYHKGDRDLGFYKFYYQFLLHSFCADIAMNGHYAVVHLDQRLTKYKLAHLCSVLNNGIRKKCNVDYKVVRNVQAAGSHDHDLMQAADVVMGAIGYHWNDCHLRPGAKPAKVRLAEVIADRAKLMSLKQPTPFRMKHFGIWPFRFGGGKKK